MNKKLITPPSVEPITLDEAQTYLRSVTDDEGAIDDADLIESLIRSAREWVERVTGRALIAQTWEMVLDAFPTGTHDAAWIELRPVPLWVPPATEEIPDPSPIVSIRYYDTAGVQQTLAADQYEVDLYTPVGAVYPVPEVSWPTAQTRRNAVVIRYTVGYGTLGADVPAPLRDTIKILVAHGYEYREAGAFGSFQDLQFGVWDKINPYRFMDLS